MSIMIPETIPPDAPHSERTVFDLLRDDPATDGWVVIHSSEHGTPQGLPREIDFLIMMPGCGIVCLEVKGGDFDVVNGQWYALGSRASVQSPVDQGRAAMFALKNDLESAFPNLTVPIDCVVAFTDCDWPDEVSRPARTVIDYNEMHNLAIRLKGVGVRMRSGNRSGSALAPFTTATVDRLRQYLAPSFTMELVTAVGPQLDSIQDQLIRLTEEQYAALDLTRDNDRCLFKGAAGTGKTLLAIECARREAEAGHKVALVCFNRLLANWLKQRTRGISGITAGTFWSDLMTPIIEASSLGSQFNGFDRSVGDPDLFASVYPQYSRRALRETGPPFDILIVDEAQDLCQSPYLEILDLALLNGLERGRWAMFGDFTNQAIFLSDSTDPESELLRYFPHPAIRQLLVNCRNTPPIARHTALIGRGENPDTLSPHIHGPTPSYVYWSNGASLSDLLDKEIHRLLAEDVRISEITVLAANRLENSSLDPDQTYGSYPLVDYSRGGRLDMDDEGAAHLKFCSVQSFKGLESHVVVLVLERLDRGFDGPHAYIGMSRARGALTVLAHNALEPEIESRLAC